MESELRSAIKYFRGGRICPVEPCCNSCPFDTEVYPEMCMPKSIWVLIYEGHDAEKNCIKWLRGELK